MRPIGSFDSLIRLYVGSVKTAGTGFANLDWENGLTRRSAKCNLACVCEVCRFHIAY